MQEKDIETSLFLKKSIEKLEEKLLARKSLYSYKITLISQLIPKYFFFISITFTSIQIHIGQRQ